MVKQVRNGLVVGYRLDTKTPKGSIVKVTYFPYAVRYLNLRNGTMFRVVRNSASWVHAEVLNPPKSYTGPKVVTLTKSWLTPVINELTCNDYATTYTNTTRQVRR